MAPGCAAHPQCGWLGGYLEVLMLCLGLSPGHATVQPGCGHSPNACPAQWNPGQLNYTNSSATKSCPLQSLLQSTPAIARTTYSAAVCRTYAARAKHSYS